MRFTVIASISLLYSTNAFNNVYRPSFKNKIFVTSTTRIHGVSLDENDTITKGIEEVRDSMGFRNDGKYWFMKTVLQFLKPDTGKRIDIKAGLVDVVEEVTEEEAEKRRNYAADNLINIDEDESTRRIDLGKKVLIAACFYAAFVSIFVDQGDFFGHFVRVSIFPFISLGYGLLESGKASL
eukprot:CAMPEP_0178955982 /NCGR_PEP_ID=MMETSP0789-20121207/9941_1 /TAXON_ID=3005 /ORGANISM="Rhizosolenia setigera, Strain CCMP 1694" /LENGTH=180 /DNA_ID=CAMNT_0020637741 /DNA_START=44 /DNA_END=586 /DNA_ORIENTATION=+